MKHFLIGTRGIIVRLPLHIALIFLFASEVNAANVLPTAYQTSRIISFLLTNGLIAFVFLILGFYLLRRS